MTLQQQAVICLAGLMAGLAFDELWTPRASLFLLY